MKWTYLLTKEDNTQHNMNDFLRKMFPPLYVEEQPLSKNAETKFAMKLHEQKIQRMKPELDNYTLSPRHLRII